VSSSQLAEANFDRMVSVTWQGVPMRDALARLANANRVGLFIDRRVDPTTLINFKAENKTVRQVFLDFADSAGLYCYFFGSVVYIGQDKMRDIFPLLISRHRKFVAQIDKNAPANKMLPAARAKLQRLVNIRLPMLSEPKNVLKNLAQQHQFTWHNLDKVPHDVWAENILPPMPMGDFLILMLVGFDLDYVCEFQDKDSSDKNSPVKNSSDKMILRIIDISENKPPIKL
jgi:hypothetical protein